MKYFKISVIGAGTWGTTIANLIALKGNGVKIWAREKEVIENINKKNENHVFLKGIKLSRNLTASSDLEEVIKDADIIINAVPVQYIRSTYSSVKNIKKNKIILNLSKGIEISTLKLPSEILKEIFKTDTYSISGPNFAVEIARQKPAATTVSGPNIKIRRYIQKLIHTHYLRVYENDDIKGCEIAGAVKNVIAIAAGMCDALDLGHNTKAALITRGLNEIRRLGKKIGARDITFLGLSGIGDLILTCNSNISRNYRAGYDIVKKGEISDKIHIIEGLYTAKAVYKLTMLHNIEMPISKEVYNIIYRKKDPYSALKTLMTRKLKSEFNE